MVSISRISCASLTSLLAALAAAVAAAAGAPASAQAQEWDNWERPLRARPRPPAYYDDYDRYDPPRSYDRRRWYRRDNDDGWDAPDAYAPDERRAGRPSWREDDFDAEDADEMGRESGKPAGVTGGARPVIAPKAPPIVPFSAAYKPGSVVIDTGARKLYYVRGHMSAFAYSIGVGRDGFSWTGKEKVSRISDWPEWYPPAEMRKRKPELPERMLGGLNNPLGAKAIYLGNTLYRIHGTNDPKSIGRAESSGCFRMLNANVMHLSSLVSIGTEVTVVRSLGRGSVTADASDEAGASTAPKPRVTQRARPAPRVQWSADPDSEPSYTGNLR